MDLTKSSFTKQTFKTSSDTLKNMYEDIKKSRGIDNEEFYKKTNMLNQELVKIENIYGGYNMVHSYHSVCIDLGENLGPLHPVVLKKLNDNGFKIEKIKNINLN
jgi:hypothetical protein